MPRRRADLAEPDLQIVVQIAILEDDLHLLTVLVSQADAPRSLRT